MKKIIAVISAVLLTAAIARMAYVNIKAERPDIRVYEMGTQVPYNDNYFENEDEQMNGYSITVLSARIVKTEDFLKEHNIADSVTVPPADEATVHNYVPEYVYDVVVNIKNTDNTEGGISMFNTGIISDDIFLRVDHTIWNALYPQLSGSLTFKLIENSDEDIHLPFGIEYYYTNVNKKCALTVDDLYSRDFQLVISKYPVNQRINIVRDAS